MEQGKYGMTTRDGSGAIHVKIIFQIPRKSWQGSASRCVLRFAKACDIGVRSTEYLDEAIRPPTLPTSGTCSLS